MTHHPIALALFLCCPAAGPLLAQTPTPGAAQASPTADDYEGLLLAAREHERAGRHEQAIAAYSRLLARQPDNADVLLARGRVHAWMGRWPEAEADLTGAVAAAPEYADAWSVLGNMYLWSDRPGKAAEAYGRWAQLRPDDPAPRLARTRALKAAEDAALARTQLEAESTASAASPASRRRASGITVPEGYRWTGSLSSKVTTFSRDRDSWNDHTLSVRRHFEGGSLALELLDAHRFGRNDQAWALDAYADLWHHAYANVRYQHSSQAALFPGRAWRVEVYQGVGQGWEISASYDRLEFAPPDIGMHAFGVGKYAGNFYLQGRALWVQGNDSPSHRGLVRYYYAGDGDNYFEASAGTGRSSDELARTRGVTDTIRRSSIGLAWVAYWSPRWGFKIAADYANEERGYAERGISGTVYRRW